MLEKICECCGKTFDSSLKLSKYSSGRFCSIKCTKSFSSKEKRREINNKVSLSLQTKWNNLSEEGKFLFIDKLIKSNFIKKRRDDGLKISKSKIRYDNIFCEMCGKEISEDRKIKRFCSNSCARKVGGLACSKVHCIGGHTSKIRIDYTSVTGEIIKLQSNYELAVARSLDQNNVKWERPQCVFWKDDQNKTHRYYPDFYLKDYNIYLDPKNDYLISKHFDKIKKVCNQNNIIVLIITKEQLEWEEIEKIIYII